MKNVLSELANVTLKIYPLSDIDYPDFSLKISQQNYKYVKFGNNVLIGKNVKIGKNTYIGSNTIIERNIEVDIIGSGVIIKNSIIGKKVMIQDGCKIVQGWFYSHKRKNIKFPHIGKVNIKDNVKIASNCTIDRGSIDDTSIGKNTYLDSKYTLLIMLKLDLVWIGASWFCW